MGGSNYIVKVKNGEGNYTLPVLDVKQYKVTLTFNNDNYTNNNNETIFNITKGDNNFTVTVGAVNYPENATVVITASDDGKYIVKVNGTDYNVIVENGKGNVTINVLNVGTYDVNVTFNSTNYKNLNNSTKLTVEEGINTLNVTIADFEYGKNTTAIVEASVDGNYTLTIGENEYNVTVSANKGSVIIKDLSVGNYTAVLTFDNNNYKNKDNKTTFNVTKVSNSFDVTVNAVNYPENATVIITASADGQYIVKVNEKEYEVNVENGAGNVTINVLNAGEYDVNVTFNSTDYKNLENSTTLTVNKGINTLSVSIGETTYQTEGIAFVTASADGNYTLNINGTDYTVEVVNGIGNTTFKGLNIGTYNANLTFTDSVANNYNNTKNSTEFNVGQAKYDVSISVENVYYPAQAVVNVTASVNGKYYLTVNGKTYNVTVSDNKASQTIDLLPVDTYSINITYSDNENYTQVVNTTDLTVNKGLNNLSVSIANVDKDTNATAYVLASVDGNYTLNVNCKDYNVTVKDNKGNVTIDKLGVGNYTAVLSFVNPNYANNQSTTTFRVANAMNNLNISFDSVVYPANATAHITASVDGNYTVTVNEKVYNVIVENGAAEVTLDVLNAGTYTATLTLLNSSEYANPTNTTEFTVSKIKNNLTVSVDNITYLQNAIVKVAASENGNYTVTVNGKSYNLTVKGGNGNITLSNLAAGNYTVTVTFSDTVNYENPTNTTNFTVAQKENTLSVEIDNVTYPSNITVNVKADIDGIYTVTIDGVSYQVTVNNTVGNISLLMTPKEYTATVTFPDAQNYTQTQNQTTFTVSKGKSKFNVTVSDVGYGDDIVIAVNGEEDGLYLVTIVGSTISDYVNVVGGTVSISIPNTLTVLGEYEVQALFTSSRYFDVTTNTTTFNLTKGNIKLNVSVENVTFTNDIVFNAVSSTDGDYIVTLNNNNYTLAVENGTGSLVISNLPASQYTATVTATDSTHYNEYSKEIEFEVKKATDYDVEITVYPAAYGNTVSVLVELINATGTVTVDNLYNATFSNGRAMIDIPGLAIGTYNFTVSYAGDDNYGGFSKNITAYLVTSIEANDATSVYNNNYDFKADLLNGDVTSLSNTSVNVTVDGVLRTVTTDENGTITLSQLAIGTHTVIIQNPVTNETKTVSVVVSPRISENVDIVVDYYSGSSFTVRVYGDDGNVISGAAVQFTFKGATYTGVSDANGYASFKITGLPGQYGVTASYKGQSVSNTITIHQTLHYVKYTTTVKKSAKKLTLKATLKSHTGKGIKGKKITFKLNGKKYTGKTSSKGVAKVTIKKSAIKKLKAGKKYKVTITYAKNTIKCYVKVKK